MLEPLQKPSLALLTDLYELTMAYAHFQSGLGDRRAAFHVAFRNSPFEGGYTIACGLGPVLDFLENLEFSEDDLAYLATLRGGDDSPLFTPEFLEHLSRFRLTLDVDAVPEGSVVFPHEPLVRVVGPILQAQLVETALLTLINFQSLVATKSARITQAAEGAPVVEFGLRRAQGFDGGLSASRAAYIGGCVGTSNVLAGKMYGIPVKGTHAHSWVMCFESELRAFEVWAEALPNSALFLVDTYKTLDGVRHAIEVGQRLRERGHDLVGIRLDSGDLAYLSLRARQMLDAAGFQKAVILASNELDEYVIKSLLEQGAPIGMWGVGTRLVTAYDDAALNGVYKLSAFEDVRGRWQPRIKLSEQAAKVSIPGILQVRRFMTEHGELIADAIYDHTLGVPSPCTIVDPRDITRQKSIPKGTAYEDLLVPVLRGGERVYDPPPLAEVQKRVKSQLAALHPGVRRFVNPHQYPAGLESQLSELRQRLILELRGIA
jgi:nicotinate phosphoribosyltransferase